MKGLTGGIRGKSDNGRSSWLSGMNQLPELISSAYLWALSTLRHAQGMPHRSARKQTLKYEAL
jgi:hypothetical protein